MQVITYLRINCRKMFTYGLAQIQPIYHYFLQSYGTHLGSIWACVYNSLASIQTRYHGFLRKWDPYGSYVGMPIWPSPDIYPTCPCLLGYGTHMGPIWALPYELAHMRSICHWCFRIATQQESRKSAISQRSFIPEQLQNGFELGMKELRLTVTHMHTYMSQL